MLSSGQKRIFLMTIDHFTCWIEVKIVVYEMSINIKTFVKESFFISIDVPGKFKLMGEDSMFLKQ